ncbi:MAG: glycosyltransferase, partial [Candidatus Latescibacteria bacterium]|nr:glycosyltransferase [Candidatus Latescibacterota bacterium]
PSYYQLAHIAVVLGRPTANYRLGLSVKLLENMRCGIPVITCLGENKKIIEQNDCGLICKWNDINDIADKMETLVKDKGLRERLGKNGRKAVEEHYNWEKMEERLRGVYEAVS